jgi:Flp pilus assembly protein protease CpaA
MFTNFALLIIAFVALVAGTITDIRKREVPDWVSFGLIFAGIGLRLVYSSVTFDWIYLIDGLLGLSAFVALGYLMFYAGQWGGGDSKLLMGLGAVIGLPLSLQPLPLLLVFLVNVIFFGSFYGMVYSLVLAFRHWKKVVYNYKRIMSTKIFKRIRHVSLVIVAMLAAVIIFRYSFFWPLLVFLFLAHVSIYAFAFIKAVEKSTMFKLVDPVQLTEGDWIADEVVVDGERICGPKDLGIEKSQIAQLIELKRKRKIDRIKIKEGIPFVPSFLIAFIVSLAFGAWWMYLL